MDQRAENACGAHYDIPSGFDYTCDDCMLPYNHYDPPELNDLDDPKDNEKRTRRYKKGEKTWQDQDRAPF